MFRKSVFASIHPSRYILKAAFSMKSSLTILQQVTRDAVKYSFYDLRFWSQKDLSLILCQIWLLSLLGGSYLNSWDLIFENMYLKNTCDIKFNVKNLKWVSENVYFRFGCVTYQQRDPWWSPLCASVATFINSNGGFLLFSFWGRCEE